MIFLDSSTAIAFHAIVIWASSVHILVALELLLTSQRFLYADPLNCSTDTLLSLLLVPIMQLWKMLLQTFPFSSRFTDPEPAPYCAFSDCCCSIAGNNVLQLQERHIHNNNMLPTNLTNKEIIEALVFSGVETHCNVICAKIHLTYTTECLFLGKNK